MAAQDGHNLPSDVTPLLQEKVKVVVMRYRDIPTAHRAYERAFTTDSLMPYFVSADTAPFYEARTALNHALSWGGAIHDGRMLTIERGAATMKYSSPGNNSAPWWTKKGLAVLKRFAAPEANERWGEFGLKMQEMLQESGLSEKVADMHEIQALWCDPSAQGKGYGTALARYVMALSDVDGHDVWLVTTDAWTFYDYLGFTKVCSGVVAAIIQLGTAGLFLVTS
ncbi:uncharacterized protein BXZ73DRAFT_97387 [Epithele typhae]|uniref:uncharacterized protein n=1 Tax=Epithele typhae TaxID=378194 RepID=UPI002008C25B|nr:uncharacterized protein BXZ73DRAFT_97387 [Epithele typhae]KAH9943344.1 hypothetical protein BXZ73DRAFT_97387 [Epithele typhae]